jgi:hypothetical protein
MRAWWDDARLHVCGSSRVIGVCEMSMIWLQRSIWDISVCRPYVHSSIARVVSGTFFASAPSVLAFPELLRQLLSDSLESTPIFFLNLLDWLQERSIDLSLKLVQISEEVFGVFIWILHVLLE